MSITSYNSNNRTFPESAFAPWVEWRHISKGKTHCFTCLKLDKCWFAKVNMPMLPQHMFCHCTVVPKSTLAVQREAKAVSPNEKFSAYLFNKNNPQNKGKAKLFQLWGYDVSDSVWMVNESERQALEKYIAGEYTLGKLDCFGQRIHIQMTIPNRMNGKKVTFLTAWMIKPGGKLVLITPYGDDK